MVASAPDRESLQGSHMLEALRLPAGVAISVLLCSCVHSSSFFHDSGSEPERSVESGADFLGASAVHGKKRKEKKNYAGRGNSPYIN
eukprot:1161191-Pelagomonas_calceolata.AAC.1